MEYPVISIVIATYNSEKVLPMVLKAIENQTYPRESIEILAIDGGSTDKTLKIAQKYSCIIHNNPKTEPANAKIIGMKEAKGKYVIFLDHDEVMESKDSILNKVHAIQKNSKCKAVLSSGYKSPPHYPLLNQYISEFGDPFSCFLYNFSKYNKKFERVLKKNYSILKENMIYMIVSFEKMNKAPLFELCCAGTMIEKEYFLEIPNVLEDSSVFVHTFYIMLDKGETSIIVMKEDSLLHYSVDSLKAYFPKLKWRICNNIYFLEKKEMGFGGRIKYQRSIRYKKYLFIPYAFSIILPLFQSIYLAITRKNIIYLMHVVLTVYVAAQIVIQYALRVLGCASTFKSYDGKKTIER